MEDSKQVLNDVKESIGIKIMQKMLLSIFLWVMFLFSAWADNLPIAVFPMDNYAQKLPISGNDGALLTSQGNQLERFNNLKSHYFGLGKNDQSPWSELFITHILHGNVLSNIYLNEQHSIAAFTNPSKSNTFNSRDIGYGINYLPYDNKWINTISNNMQLEQFKNLKYNKSKRAIATNNLEAYAVPTIDPWFLSYTRAGNGFPFNLNLLSNINLGTSLYVVGESQDKAWLLVITPYFMAWVKAVGVAYTDNTFINSWIHLTNKSMIAIITPNVSLINNKVILGSALAGTILPAISKNTNDKKIVYIPVREINGYARILSVYLNSADIVTMPLVATKKNIMLLINKLIGRNYGWGGFMGYNDCSGEMQAIFTPLGYFMPRNSSQQINSGDVFDLSSFPAADRMAYLVKNGKPFMTLVYIKGHIMLYVGNVKINKKEVPLVYQNIWGIAPPDRSKKYIIGSAVFLPLMLSYPEISAVDSILDRDVFKLVYLNNKLADINMLNIIY